MLIKPALVEQVGLAPGSWAQLPHGRWLRHLEQAVLKPYWTQLAGDYVLQLGPLSAAVSGPCKATEKIAVHQGEQANVRAELTALPFARRSVDIVVLAHALEYHKDPHQVLREADHALTFDGYMVITLYNPISIATLSGLWPRHMKLAPWNGRYFSHRRIEDWLALLNYQVIASGYYGNSSLWPSLKDPETGCAALLRRLPQLRCCYYLIARKRVFPLTPSPGLLRFASPMGQTEPAPARATSRSRHERG